MERRDFPDGRCSVTVSLRDRTGRTVEGEGSGTRTRQGVLRAAAEATLESLRQVIGGRVALSLGGIKAVRAFDGLVIITSIRIRDGERSWTLLGAQAGSEEAFLRAAALSILDATNRVLTPYLPQD